MKKITELILLIGPLVMLTGCYYDVEEELYPAASAADCDTSNATYSLKVLPVIQSNCYSCHSGLAPLGIISLEGYANLKTYADDGRLMGVITHAAGFPAMPQGGTKLNDCTISVIQTWIDNGALNN